MMYGILMIRVLGEVSSLFDSLVFGVGKRQYFIGFEVIKYYLDVEIWQISEIQKGLAEIEVSEFITHEEVGARFVQGV